jgi:hypothetical protein
MFPFLRKTVPQSGVRATCENTDVGEQHPFGRMPLAD